MAVRTVLFVMIYAAVLAGQTPGTGTVQGQVTDRGGGVVSGAAVTLRNEALGVQRFWERTLKGGTVPGVFH